MSGMNYDESCALEFAALQSKLSRYFVELATECPYGLPHTAYFYQAMFGPLTDHAMELFLAAGYRRNGNCLYSMHCRDCRGCVPIRLRPSRFRPNRNQKRVWNKNSDIDISIGRVEMSKEHLQLCGRFLEDRYPQEHNTAEGYYGGFFCNSIIESARLEFHHEDRLVGGSIIDLGENWMNAVYFYFDPEYGSRSLGTYNILYLIDMCRKHSIEFLYLGYYIEEISAMNYKTHFQPYELFLDRMWRSSE